jgi:acetyl-CoA synthetase
MRELEEKIYEEGKENPVLFWENLAKKLFWYKLWREPFSHTPPYVQWFSGAKTNISTNIFEKNIAQFEEIKDKVAILWEPESPGEQPKKITYQELFEKVNKLSNALFSLGVKRGDRVAIFLPPLPELVISVLACARIGAVYSILSPFLPAESIKERLNLIEAEFLITCDAGRYQGEEIELKKEADSILMWTPVKKVIVVNRLGKKVDWIGERDVWYEEITKLQKKSFQPIEIESEEPIFILTKVHPSSKITPILHNVGGFLVQTFWTGQWLFNLKPQETIFVYGDFSWIFPHNFGIYYPLLAGATTLIFEGDPLWPINNRWLEILQKYQVKVFATFPVMVNRFKKFSSAVVEGYKLNNLKKIAVFGESLSEEKKQWLFESLGKKEVEILDIYTQAETGGPLFWGKSLPGLRWEIIDDEGRILPEKETGNLVILPPFCPSFFRGCFKNEDDFLFYWQKYGKKVYYTRDIAFKEKENNVKIIGRGDEIIKIAGYNIHPKQIEDIINSYPEMVESVVIDLEDEISGKILFAFLVYKGDRRKEIVERVSKERIKKKLGRLFLPKAFYFVEDLPKYFSRKVAKDVLKKILKREKVENLDSLLNPEIVERIEILLFE